ncbi:MAG TPA: PAS domain S-box protein [Acidobacteriaceae bacterium]|nr:PAS domain S-box protein [Acidobacteriaceae bacterium]
MPADMLPSVMDPESLLSAIVDSSDDAIISRDLNGIITSWNAAACRIFGYAAEEIVGQSILRLIPDDLHPEQAVILAKIRAGERIDHCETTRRRKDGNLIGVSVTISPVRDRAGRIVGASKIARDISERRRREESRSHLAAIVDSSDDAIVSKDLNGIITSWNAGAYRVFGYTAEEIVGQSILRLIPDELYPEEAMILEKLRAGERIDHYETTRRRKDGNLIEVSVTISPIRDDAGRVIGASKIARDISERKETERRIIQSEKFAATGRMAATVAHEINNPLESVMNLVYLARKQSSPRGKAFAYLQLAEKELERVSHLARQTLGYYRETGSPVKAMLHELLRDVLKVYESKLRSGGIAVDCQFHDRRPIMVSRGEVLQVFSNVIANAVDAMPTGGKLQIQTRETTSTQGEGVQVTIRDSGTGIPREYLDRIFEPFFTTKGNLGTGIGLWVSRQLIEKRGGRLSVESGTEEISRGTVMSIFLPFVPTTPEAGEND